MRRFLLSLAIAASTALGSPAFAQQSGTAAMPSCSAGDPVVWVNTRTKVYHMQGDSYYGKTKHGKYLCKSTADAQNYKVSGSHSTSSGATSGTNMNTGTTMKSGGTQMPMSSGAAPGTNMNSGATHMPMSSGAAPGTNMNPNSAASPAPAGMMSSSKSHKHHHHHKSMASPNPAMMPSPAAS